MLKIISALVLSLLAVGAGQAASFRFDSTVVEVKVDTGSSRYTGMTVGELFSGRFDFGNRAGDAGLGGVGPDVAQYGFFGSTFGSRIESRGIPTESLIVVMALSENSEVSAVDAAFLNDLFGTAIAPQTPTDVFGIFGHTFGTYYDNNDVFYDGAEFGIILFLDPATYADVDLKTVPPDLADALGGFFFISEADAFGNEIFRAHGAIDSIEFAPVPNCIIELSQASYQQGETVTASQLDLHNPSAASLAMEVKLWWRSAAGVSTSVVNVGADGALVVPPGWQADLAPLAVHAVDAATVPGDYQLGCRLLNPETGEVYSEDLRPYRVE